MTIAPPSPNPQQPSGERFEDEVRFILRSSVPECFLTSVTAFPCDKILSSADRELGSLAYEVDFLIHLRAGVRDVLLLVECKAQDITNAKGFPPTAEEDWFVRYPRFTGAALEPKPVKRQLQRQAQTLLLNVEPFEGKSRLQCWGVVVARNLPSTAKVLEDKRGLIPFTLVPFAGLSAWLATMTAEYEVLRVQQSPLLRRLRQGQAVRELGHPELSNALAYARRVRAFLDSELFRHFEPGTRQWAINGSAGMGKSVLLGYALTAVVTDRVIAHLGDGTPHLQLFTEVAAKVGMVPLERRRVILAAHSHKQQAMLEAVARRFEARYHEIDSFNEYRRIKPTIRTWSEIDDAELASANVVLVDEAHDLGPSAQARLKAWFDESSDHYLIVACDRHQKLRHISKESRILDGFDFSRCTTRLARNYRNPFPVHAAAIGIMFRWFCAAGPKIIPNQETLQLGLGFTFQEEGGGSLVIGAREDAHPANNWNHLVGRFSSPHETMEQLREFALSKDDLLWVRFREEDPTFSYESLNSFTYHPLFGPDAAAVTDKYIKGQEFPVVVIEGMPETAAWSAIEPGMAADAEEMRTRKMWEARRLVYLAASRATLFLIFVIPPHESAEFQSEINQLLKQLSRPAADQRQSPSGKLWTISLKTGSEVWEMPRYLRLLGSDMAGGVEVSIEKGAMTVPPAPEKIDVVPSEPEPKAEPEAAPTEPVLTPSGQEQLITAEQLAFLAREVAPTTPALVPQSEAECRVLASSFRGLPYADSDWKGARQDFRAAVIATSAIRVWARLAGAPPKTANEVHGLRTLRGLLAGKAVDLRSAPPGQSPAANTKTTIEPRTEPMAVPQVVDMLRLLVTKGVFVEPTDDLERYVADSAVRGRGVDKRVRARCRPAFVAIIAELQFTSNELRPVAKRPPSDTDTDAVRALRRYLTTPPLRMPSTTWLVSAPVAAVPSVSMKTIALQRPCVVGRPVTPFKISTAADLPRHRVLDALILSGYRSFSEHMTLTDEMAHEIAGRLGRRLTITNGTSVEEGLPRQPPQG